jgi:hypothetical protein
LQDEVAAANGCARFPIGSLALTQEHLYEESLAWARKRLYEDPMAWAREHLHE